MLKKVSEVDRTAQQGIKGTSRMGSSVNSKTYLVGIPIDKGIFMVRKSRNATFNENENEILVKM